MATDIWQQQDSTKAEAVIPAGPAAMECGFYTCVDDAFHYAIALVA